MTPLSTYDTQTNLTHKFLIALPGTQDPRFRKRVLFICHHNAHGAMGVMINKAKIQTPNHKLMLSDILPQIGIDGKIAVDDSQVLEGGPVDKDRGFLIHSDDVLTDSVMLPLPHGLCLSANKTLLESLVTDEAPSKALLAIGYTSWAAGQLEREIQSNEWIVSDSDPSLIFQSDRGAIWNDALGNMGISPALLAPVGGTA